MNITFNTKNVDASIALKALAEYKSGKFEQAISSLLSVLDREPGNVQARQMIGVCYYKTQQYLAARWAFRFVYDNARNEETKRSALDGLQATNAKLMDCPPEFASFYERSMPSEAFCGWLDGSPSGSAAPPPGRKAWKPSFNR